MWISLEAKVAALPPHPHPPHGKEGTVQLHLLDPGEPGCWLGPPELALLPLLEWMGLRLELVLFALWPAGSSW